MATNTNNIDSLHTGTNSITVNRIQQPGQPGCVFPAPEAPSLTMGLAMFPNPADKEIVIRLAEPSDIEMLVDITDAFGRTVISSSIDAFTIEKAFDSASLPDGIYIVRVASFGTSHVVKKVSVFHQ